MPEDTPFGWGDFDINGEGTGPIDGPRVVDRDPPSWATVDVDVGDEHAHLHDIHDIPKPPPVPVGPGTLSTLLVFLCAPLEWFATKIPASWFTREEVDDLTLKGASIVLLIVILVFLFMILMLYGVYRGYKNRSGYNKILRYVGNNRNLPGDPGDPRDERDEKPSPPLVNGRKYKKKRF